MKLSEILGWPNKKDVPDRGTHKQGTTRAFNAALMFCDREIDNKELAHLILEFYETECADDAMDIPRLADHIISTMPTWLKRSEE